MIKRKIIALFLAMMAILLPLVATGCGKDDTVLPDEGLEWNEQYLSKNYANQLIEYLSEKSYIEPAIFSFFFVSK